MTPTVCWPSRPITPSRNLRGASFHVAFGCGAVLRAESQLEMPTLESDVGPAWAGCTNSSTTTSAWESPSASARVSSANSIRTGFRYTAALHNRGQGSRASAACIATRPGGGAHRIPRRCLKVSRFTSSRLLTDDEQLGLSGESLRL